MTSSHCFETWCACSWSSPVSGGNVSVPHKAWHKYCTRYRYLFFWGSRRYHFWGWLHLHNAFCQSSSIKKNKNIFSCAHGLSIRNLPRKLLTTAPPCCHCHYRYLFKIFFFYFHETKLNVFREENCKGSAFWRFSFRIGLKPDKLSQVSVVQS